MIIGFCLLIFSIIKYCILLLLIISYCKLIHPGICFLWCRTRMRPARLVSYAFLYTANMVFFGSICLICDILILTYVIWAWYFLRYVKIYSNLLLAVFDAKYKIVALVFLHGCFRCHMTGRKIRKSCFHWRKLIFLYSTLSHVTLGPQKLFISQPNSNFAEIISQELQ